MLWKKGGLRPTTQVDVRSEAFAAAKVDKIFSGYQSHVSAHHTVMMGTGMIVETSVIFKKLSRLRALEDFAQVK